VVAEDTATAAGLKNIVVDEEGQAGRWDLQLGDQSLELGIHEIDVRSTDRLRATESTQNAAGSWGHNNGLRWLLGNWRQHGVVFLVHAAHGLPEVRALERVNVLRSADVGRACHKRIVGEDWRFSDASDRSSGIAAGFRGGRDNGGSEFVLQWHDHDRNFRGYIARRGICANHGEVVGDAAGDEAAAPERNIARRGPHGFRHAAAWNHGELWGAVDVTSLLGESIYREGGNEQQR